VTCDGAAWTEIVQQSHTCRALLDKLLASDLPDRVKARVAEDGQTFTYAERTLDYYDACIRGFQAAQAKRLEEARSQYSRAKEIARLLAEDKVSTSLSSAHANAANAFEATLATGALKHLARLLDEPMSRKP